jgi:hypothetical protein
MSKSYRIRTKVGVDTSVKVLIDQEFEHLEILSLKILQTDIYTRQCADYGVIVGRVSVNNGFGVPNAKVSIFIPLDSKDQADPIISELYPYKSLLDNNDDGYRYNLLPYKPSYSAHVPTGTFFTRLDVLTNPTLIEVYDKYYKYNAVTNDSGDYMIFGVPVGAHLIVLDVDLSDIGEFSLSPQDLIRMGIATEAQVSGTNFKSSNNLRELPQIVSVNRSIEVEPLWGQPDICNLGITRTDFDLSSEANVDIRPTSIFMGSIISDSDTNALRTNCKPTNRSGYQCSLTTGPGEILAIRQTIQQDSNGLPILENFSLEGGGKVIDENGTWLVDVPMNMDYYVTNEFGEQVISNDPEVGIPTKAKYRFKVKWAQSPSLSDLTKRAYFLVPNIREYTSYPTESYAFSVDWADYGDSQMIQEAINCDDKFYMMQYNKVYTVSEFIDNFKKGSGAEKYIGIKNILEESCETENNKFPTNDGNFRFDILYIIFMFFSIILTPVFFALILLLHILYFVVWLLRIIVLPGLIVWCLASIVNYAILIIGCVPYALGMIAGYAAMIVIYLILSILLYYILRKLWEIDLKGIKVPILTYPDCDLCSCTQGQPINEEPDPDGAPTDEEDKLLPCPTIFSDPRPISPLNNGLILSPVSTFPGFRLPSYNAETNPTGFTGQLKTIFANDFAGYTFDGQYGSSTIGAPYLQSEILTTGSGGDTVADEWDWFTNGLPLADRINLFNVKAKYFNNNPVTNPGGGVNRISVNFETGQTQVHYDNTIVILCDKSTAKKFTAGQMISFQNPSYTKDPNLKGGIKNKFNNYAITGTSYTGNTQIRVNYANFNGSGNVPSHLYNVTITATSTTNIHKFPIDVEYFQVITGMTYSSFSGMCVNLLPNSLNKKYFANDTTFFKMYNNTNGNKYGGRGYIAFVGAIPGQLLPGVKVLKSMSYVRYVSDNYVVILNRGVDPYTSKIPIEYGLGKLFGHGSESAVKVKGFYRMNIPIQGGFKNISHSSSERASITPLPAWTPLPSGGTSNFVIGQTWVGGNPVTVGGNVNNENTYANGQQLYFNSFSYCDNQRETWEYITGYTNGLTAVTWTQKTSRFSGFNSNLISYYSNLDNRSITSLYKPTCNNIQPPLGTPNSGDDEATPKPQTPLIGDGAISSINGVSVSTNNGFTLAWSRNPNIISTYNGTCGVNYDCGTSNLPWMTLSPIPSLRYYSTTGRNEGYIPNEIVEGASMLHMRQNIPTGPVSSTQQVSVFTFCCSAVQTPRVYPFYYSPIYATTANTMNFTLGSVGTTYPGMTENQIVMRGDRLPTSTNVEEFCCNGRVLQKNSKFAIYQIPETGVIGINSVSGPSGSFGNGSLDDVREELGASPKINQVINTFTCDGSVNLECYDCKKTTVNSTILIKPRGNPCLEFNGETIFEGGCYVFITTIFISLLRDWELMFEWIARNMVMLGACRNVFSHRFNNNWVNGVLYAFPFKNEVRGFSSPTANPPNAPDARYCGRNGDGVITYHNPSRSFYYRCSPYNYSSGEFSGPLNYPTTIMDLGPRADFLQELVMSDEYDGYLVNKLTSSTYSHVDEILNLFIVSRFMDNNFLNNLLGAFNIFAYFQNGRNGRFLIDADYAQLISINSELGVAAFQSSNYPDSPTLVGAGGFVTGIQYKIVSGGTSSNPTNFTSIGATSNAAGTLFIATGPGSGTGTANVDPEIQNPIFFDCSNSLGIFFSSDLQVRDYVTPKRTIINPTGTTVSNCTFNNFPVYSQQVPLSQWFIDAGGNKGSIFGGESNDWKYDTVYSSKYQSLDRLSQSSRYFRSNNQSQNNFLKGYIYAVTSGISLPTTQNNSITAIIANWNRNTSDPDYITVGAPFHFYFGLKRGASSFDRFRTKWINTSNIVN